jgi:hypothetical protein
VLRYDGPTDDPPRFDVETSVGRVVVGHVLGVAGEGIEAESPSRRDIAEADLSPTGEPSLLD